jgi:hypothetical protein
VTNASNAQMLVYIIFESDIDGVSIRITLKSVTSRGFDITYHVTKLVTLYVNDTADPQKIVRKTP